MRAESAVAAAALLALSFAGSFAAAAPRDYRIDPVHTRVLLSVDHLGFSEAMATLSAPRGWLRFDPDDWQDAAVEVELDLDRLDFGDAEWNERMRRRDFLDAERHPVARFRSLRVEPVDAQRARIIGLLSLRGVEREVVLDATLNRAARHPLTLRRTVGFSATAEIQRADFGMVAWRRMVGPTVALRIELEAQRARRGADADADDGDSPVADEQEHDDAVAQ